MSHTETLDRSRRHILIGSLVAFASWQGLLLWRRAAGDGVTPGARGALTIASLLCFAAWFYFIVRMLGWQRRAQADPAAAAALNDEFVQLARHKAAAVGCGAMLAVQVVAILVDAPGAAIAQLTVLVGFVSLVGAFLFFERG
ncbi:MAG TPA: hypothetical protein VGY57_12965 [Vicinamibacterales bacterium]|jgi:hypothetical protein|nr:hypothetical protein [Vicinamibacterales bacterium]